MTNHARVAEYFPDPYDGTVSYRDKEMTIIEIATLKELPPILYRFGDWVVTTKGVICLTVDYTVEKERLNEPDWHDHMSAKTWVDINDFDRALFRAQNILELEII